MTFEFDKTDLSFLLLLIPLRYPINNLTLLLSNIKCPESIRPILDPRLLVSPISLPETISSIRSVLKPDKIVEEDGREGRRSGGERNSINTGALGLYYISWFRGIKRASSPPHVCLHLFQFTCCRLPLPPGPDISFQPLPLVDVPPFSFPYSPISSPRPSPLSSPSTRLDSSPASIRRGTVSRDLERI